MSHCCERTRSRCARHCVSPEPDDPGIGSVLRHGRPRRASGHRISGPASARKAGPSFSARLGCLAVIVAYSSFYARQYYLWVTLYVAYSVFSDRQPRRAKIATTAGCLLLTMPALGLFAVWHGFTPPWDGPVTQSLRFSRRCQTRWACWQCTVFRIVWIAAARRRPRSSVRGWMDGHSG